MNNAHTHTHPIRRALRACALPVGLALGALAMGAPELAQLVKPRAWYVETAYSVGGVELESWADGEPLASVGECVEALPRSIHTTRTYDGAPVSLTFACIRR